MSRRNGSLLAFRPTGPRPAHAPSSAGPTSPTSGPAPPASADRQAAVVRQARLDCPRCDLPITVESLHWRPAERADVYSLDEAERRLVQDRYTAIREGERDYRTVVHDLERRLLGEALAESDGVMKDAARLLGIKYTTFVAKAHRLGLTAED